MKHGTGIVLSAALLFTACSAEMQADGPISRLEEWRNRYDDAGLIQIDDVAVKKYPG